MAYVLTQSISRWIDFTVRTFIVVFGIYLAISALLIPVYSAVHSANAVMRKVAEEITRLEVSSADMSTDNVKLRLFGLISNPEVHYLMAERYQAQGEYAKALQAISLAMGLARPDIAKYQKIYEELRNETSNH